jgi:CHASE3 domain sensor protein
MDELPELERIDQLEMDIDLRIRSLWAEVEEIKEWDIERIAKFVRAAYGQGYVDALREDLEGLRAKLCHDHGYKAI